LRVDTAHTLVPAFRYYGTQEEREGVREHLRPYLPTSRSNYGQLDVILAPVTYFQKEGSDDRKFLLKFKYDYLVVDEAHLLKNAQSTRYKMLNKVTTGHRLLLTGTPIQNTPKVSTMHEL
jgi:SNF2 family DNA or RNA helicase